jgi:hypothetical protein
MLRISLIVVASCIGEGVAGNDDAGARTFGSGMEYIIQLIDVWDYL